MSISSGVLHSDFTDANCSHNGWKSIGGCLTGDFTLKFKVIFANICNTTNPAKNTNFTLGCCRLQTCDIVGVSKNAVFWNFRTANGPHCIKIGDLFCQVSAAPDDTSTTAFCNGVTRWMKLTRVGTAMTGIIYDAACCMCINDTLNGTLASIDTYCTITVHNGTNADGGRMHLHFDCIDITCDI